MIGCHMSLCRSDPGALHTQGREMVPSVLEGNRWISMGSSVPLKPVVSTLSFVVVDAVVTDLLKVKSRGT